MPMDMLYEQHAAVKLDKESGCDMDDVLEMRSHVTYRKLQVYFSDRHDYH